MSNLETELQGTLSALIERGILTKEQLDSALRDGSLLDLLMTTSVALGADMADVQRVHAALASANPN